MTLLDRAGKLVADHPGAVAVGFAFLLLGSVPVLLGADVFLSIYELSPRAEYYDHFTTLNGELGWDNLAAILMTRPADKAGERVTEPEAVRHMNDVEVMLDELDFVEGTLSLAELVRVMNSRLDFVAGKYVLPGGVPRLPLPDAVPQPKDQVSGFPQEGPEGDARINASLDIALELLGDQIYGNILSRNETSALMVVVMTPGATGPEYRDWQRQILAMREDMETAGAHGGELEMRPVSIDIIYTTLDDVTTTEAPYWVLAAVLVGVTTLLVLFRRVYETSAALLSLVVVASITLAGALLLEIDFNLLSLLVAALIFAAGVDYAMHVIARYREERALGYNSRDAMMGTVRHTGPALLITTVTDTAGFMSLYFSLIPAVGDFGAMVGVGMFASFIVCLTLLPVLLMWGDRLRGDTGGSGEDPDVIEKRRKVLEEEVRAGQRTSALGRTGHWLAGRQRGVVVASVLAFALIAAPLAFKGVEVWGASYLEPVPIFEEDTYAIETLELMDRSFGIPNELAVLFYGDATDPEVVQFLDDFQQATVQVHGMTKIDSVPNVLRLYTAIINPDPTIDQDRDGLPDTREQIRTAYEEMEKDPATSLLLSRVVVHRPGEDVEYPIAAHRLGINPQPAGSLGHDIDNYRASLADVQRALQANEDEEDAAELDHGTTGLVVLGVEVVDAIVRGNAWSIFIMLGVIFVLLSLFWKSPELALIGMVPLGFAILTQYSLQALLGYEVTYVSLILTGMVTGIGVDDAVHFINRFREEVRHGRGARDAATLASAEIGSVLVGTTVTTLSPFFVILFSVVTWAAQTALLVIPTLAMALLGTLLPLPALLAWHGRRRREHYLRRTIFDEHALVLDDEGKPVAAA